MPIARDTGLNVVARGLKPDEIGLVNQYGLSRKVSYTHVTYVSTSLMV